MQKISLFVLAVMVPVFLVSCATIVRDKNQFVSFVSNVEGVDITVTNKKGQNVFTGTAPVVIPLPAANAGYFNAENYMVKASKPGFKSQTISVPANVSGWYIFGNFFFGGFIGWLIVDPISGDMFYLDDQVRIDLQPDTE